MNTIYVFNLHPVAFSFGPLEIKWYGLAYVAGILLGWRYSRSLVKRYTQSIHLKDLDDFIVWATIGVVAGGRLGYVLFYRPLDYLFDPLKIFCLWQPGMSFHGGLLGVIIAGAWFCKRRALPMLAFGDIICSAAPIGLFFGRIANFINGELFGRPTDGKWGVIFPHGGPYPRHPSQLYEAGLEGLALFFLLFSFERLSEYRKTYPGLMFSLFLMGYACMRISCEIFRQPDSFLGFFMGGSTYGQWLSLPLFITGLALFVYVRSQQKAHK